MGKRLTLQPILPSLDTFQLQELQTSQKDRFSEILHPNQEIKLEHRETLSLGALAATMLRRLSVSFRHDIICSSFTVLQRIQC